MFKYQQLIKENLSEIAKLITVEQVVKNMLKELPLSRQGKTHQDAEGDVMRGLQVVLLVFSASHQALLLKCDS